MFFEKFLSKKEAINTKNQIAEMLKISPEALAEFERSYEANILSHEPDETLFGMNAKQAAEIAAGGKTADKSIEDLTKRIVDELIALTPIMEVGNEKMKIHDVPVLTEGTAVTTEEVSSFPIEIRPQLTGNLMQRDVGEKAYIACLDMYAKSLKEKNPRKARELYFHFRQGLDILDLDEVLYEVIGTNPNSMGYWLPALEKACENQFFFKIPETRIVKVPLTLLQLTRLSYMDLTRTTLDIVDAWAREAFALDENKEYFIKTGTYSSKFDFRNAHVHGAKEVRELGEYLLFIHSQALQMASPLNTPCIYGASTTNEWVVREFIPDKENNPCIYKGLPLHTEYRVFIDCDTNEVLSIVPYWKPEAMKKRFGHESDADNPHQIHDYVIYQMHEDTLMARYHANKDRVMDHVRAILPELNLYGQWSLDVMQNGDDFWLIDMALAENSAFYESVPVELRNPTEENWIPKISSGTK